MQPLDLVVFEDMCNNYECWENDCDSNGMSSFERRMGLTTRHINIKLDPLVSRLTMFQYRSDTQVCSADFTSTGTHSFTIPQFHVISTVDAIHTVTIFVAPGTHYFWVARSGDCFCTAYTARK